PQDPRRGGRGALIVRLGAKQRIGTAVAAAIVTYVLLATVHWHTRVMVTWDIGTIASLFLSWTNIELADANSTRAHSLAQDTSGSIIFLLVVGASCASVVAIG